MPFGKYKNRPLEEIPAGYLVWVLDNCADIKPTLREAIRLRLGLNSRPAREPAAPDWPQLISGWYRRLCRDYHPDRGGSTEAMGVINEAYDRLRDLLGL
jgi:hypothetical protein